MIALVAIIGMVPGILMVIGVISVFRCGVRYGRRRERRRM